MTTERYDEYRKLRVEINKLEKSIGVMKSKNSLLDARDETMMFIKNVREKNILKALEKSVETIKKRMEEI